MIFDIILLMTSSDLLFTSVFPLKAVVKNIYIQLVTFNVRTLNRIGQLPELTASAIDHNIDIICIQEHRYLP